MSETPFDKAVAQRWFAIELNNATWEWLESGDYDVHVGEQMLHAAHASCHHWLQVGSAANHARAECLVAMENSCDGRLRSAWPYFVNHSNVERP